MADSDAGKLSEEIFTFSFRNKGSIVIPKAKREVAYVQAVDVFIESISYTAYKSAKTEPDESFYGYATLVFQDALSDKIPLRFGRNRIYQERNEQALSQWEFHRQFYSEKAYIDSFYRLLTEPDATIPAYNPPKPLFVELPLRELYVECLEDCQFKIEYTQWQPIPYQNDNSANFDGKSQQVDGDKDLGLPERVQPKQNSPSNPFAGNPSPSSVSDLGQFYNPKFGLSGENSQLNQEIDNRLYYWVTVYINDFINGCGSGKFELFYAANSVPFREPPAPRFEVVNSYTTCGEAARFVRIFNGDELLGGSSHLVSGFSLGVTVRESPNIESGFFYDWRPVGN